jgi:hypothetical protein
MTGNCQFYALTKLVIKHQSLLIACVFLRALLVNSLTSTIAQAKQNICSVIGAEGKYLRLISSGKMLAPDTAVLSAFKLPDMRYVIDCADAHKYIVQ